MSQTDDRAALDCQFGEAYEELRRLAAVVRRNDPRATVTPTTLVNEAWIKLAKSPAFAASDALHFKRVAARAMRQVLIEAARRRHADKRGHDAILVTFDDTMEPALSTDRDLLALDEALADLNRLSPRQASLVEARFFGGLDVSEVAALLEISEATALRDWRAARAWLATALKK